ncbi:MAG: dacB 3 [Firmicutes bacterium]|nr:dacB 3 [Bacillota bacterium]
MGKSSISIIRFFLLFIGLIYCLWGSAALAAPAVKANAAILMDAKTGQVLFEKSMDARNAPASTTKIMTAILAIESGRLEETAKISVYAASTRGSSMHLYPGQNISLAELVTGLLMRSGNDAAVAIAEYLAGSEDAFVEMMNKRAAELGATNTHFRNPHGLSAPGHYSSAHDLATLARYALTLPQFATIVSTRETQIEWHDRRGRDRDVNLRNTNKLLWMLDDVDGIKTGTTNEAGPCLVSSATRDNQKLIAVVLNDSSRWYDSLQLLNFGFDNYDLYDYANDGDVLGNIAIESGLSEAVAAIVDGPASITVRATDYDAVTVEVDLPEKIKAPIYQGQKIGEIIFLVGDKAVKTIDLVAANDVAERTLIKTLLYNLIQTFRLFSGWGLL